MPLLPFRSVMAVVAACAVLAVGYAAASRTMSPAWRLPPPKAPPYRPAPLAHDDSLREAYRVRLNGRAMDLARFSSTRPPEELAKLVPKEEDPVLAHPDGFGGTIYWKGRMTVPLAPASAGDCPGEDPGGVRPPNARRLLAAASDRGDALSAALYEAGPGAARALAASLAAKGWAAMDLGEGLSYWTRGGETLLLDAPGPGRPGISLVYWRLPEGETR